VAAEGFIDAVGSTGSGFVFVATDGDFNSPAESGYADIPLVSVRALSNGNHTIYVHSKDSSGNWRDPTAATTILAVDKTGPTFGTITVSPEGVNRGGGTQLVTVSGSITADDMNVVASAGLPEPNLIAIGAPDLWSLGFYGQEVVIASMDTGVDVNHPDLGSRWRDGNNSWYDPYNQHPTIPTNLDGHGTMTMGVMVGGDAGGTSIGVAPAAQWIGVKIFNDRGRSIATAIHKGFQWLLDPDGNPATAEAPEVINNSWSYGGPGCNLEFQPDLQALRAAGILPIFAAGNFGPRSSTSVSPANYPEALAVGATDSNRLIYANSSWGSSACGESSTIYPEIVAPDVDIQTTDLYGLYSNATGTSLSAPHVSGASALLLSSYPNLSADQIGYALLQSASDLGDLGPDNTFGFGGLDVLTAFNCLGAGTCLPPPPPLPLTLARASGSGEVGVLYSSSLVASGGTSPYSFAITTGSLPQGMVRSCIVSPI
jgi:subtilisin family serine protease